MSAFISRVRENLGTPLLIALLLGALLRLLVFAVALQDDQRRLEHDSREYLALARNLSAVFGANPGELNERALFRGPGYPLFVALGSALGGISGLILIQLALSMGTVMLVRQLAAQLVDRPCANAAALVAAVEPLGVIFANKVMSETLFTFLLVTGACLFVRTFQRPSPGRAVAAGLVLGAAALVRPIGLYLPLVLAVLAWTLQERPRRLSIAALLLLGALVPIGAWTIRNAAATGDVVFTTSDGKTFLDFRIAPMVAQDRGIDIGQARAELSDRVERRLPSNASPADRNAAQRAVALEELPRHPWAAIKSQVFYTARLLWGPGQASLAQVFGRSSPLAVSVLWLFVAFVYLAAAFGVKQLWSQGGGRRALWIVSAVIAYFILASSLTDGYARFRVPVMPFLAVMAGVGLVRLKRQKDVRTTGVDYNPHP